MQYINQIFTKVLRRNTCTYSILEDKVGIVITEFNPLQDSNLKS